MSNPCYPLATVAGQALAARHLTLVTAESCTGGGLGYWITAVPGSSAWFMGGFVTYSNVAKNKMLGVATQTIETEGAVSEATAMQMAQGAITHSDADIAIAITGIAGPEGGSATKPVGTVWLAWTHKNRQTVTKCAHFQGDRQQIREQAIVTALEGLIALLEI